MSSPGSAKPPAIRVERATKSFRLPSERVHTLKERALHPLRGRTYTPFPVLTDVSFRVEPGEFFGIVGRNGSGKSTLLKCMAGIYGLTEGEIYVNGSLSTFIELGVGFNPDLAAYDNVVTNGIMLGLTPREARARFDRVIEFAELAEFVDLKLKNYSSGMHVRLAFSVMIQVDAEILLIDEVLAVGDAAFQQKCFDVFNDLREQGRTIVFVSHDMGAIERFCDRALLLERGEIVESGHTHEVAARYIELNFERDAGHGQLQPRAGDGKARVLEAWAEDSAGERKTMFMQGQRCTFKARVRFHEAVTNPSFAMAWVNENRQNHLVASTAREEGESGRFVAGEEVIFSVSFENVLAPGRYFLSSVLARQGGGEKLLDRWERIISVVVAGTRASGGLVDLPCDMRIERGASASTTFVRGESK